MPTDVGPGKRVPSQRWMTFVRNHAQAIVACDFFIVVTASFRVLYVFVLLEVGTRRIARASTATAPRHSATAVPALSIDPARRARSPAVME